MLPNAVMSPPAQMLPPTPKPPVPGTIIAPVIALVLGILLLATMAPPAQMLPPMPRPPGVGITNAPVVSLVLGAVDDTLRLPPIPTPAEVNICPPTKILPVMPTPPTTCSAPVFALVLSSPLFTIKVPTVCPVTGLTLAMVAPVTSTQ